MEIGGLTKELYLEQYNRLTPREKEVLQEVARGFPNEQTGANLGISPKTVETHKHSIAMSLSELAPPLEGFSKRPYSKVLFRGVDLGVRFGVLKYPYSSSSSNIVTTMQDKIISQLALGMTNEEIGYVLDRDKKTIERHISNLRRRMGITNGRMEIVSLSSALKRDGHYHVMRPDTEYYF